MNSAPTLRKLQLGIGKIALLPRRLRIIFSVPGWTHLGETDQEVVDGWTGKVVPWCWRRNDQLLFADGEFDFIFSEHFLEHLWLDEAIFLMRECFRVMRRGARMLILVPDADLRPVPDELGYPTKASWEEAGKHKTRWSYRSLPAIMEIAGIQTTLLRYYDSGGILHDRDGWPRNLVNREDSLIVGGVKP